MSFCKWIAVVLVMSWGVLTAAQTAVAAESGSFTSITSYVRDYTVLEHAGQTIIGGPLNGTTTVIESSGGPFAEGGNSLTACFVYARQSDAGMDLEAPCTNTDSSGDKSFSMARRTIGNTEVGGGGEGRVELLGGTGKYAGVTGSCTYTANYLGANRSVSVINCEWQKP